MKSIKAKILVSMLLVVLDGKDCRSGCSNGG